MLLSPGPLLNGTTAGTHCQHQVKLTTNPHVPGFYCHTPVTSPNIAGKNIWGEQTVQSGTKSSDAHFFGATIVAPTVLFLWIVSPSKTDLQRVIYQPVVKHSNGKFPKMEVLMGKSSINLDCRQVGQQGWVPIDQPPLIPSSPSLVVLYCHQRRFTHKESTARARKRAVPSGFI